MDLAILVEAGLTDAQAKAYATLVECNPATPPHLAKLIEETRTNTYKVLEQLEELGLAKRDDINKKLHYWALTPAALLSLVQKTEEEAELSRRKVEASQSSLIDHFQKHNEQPGIRFFPGSEGVAEIYKDQLKEQQPVNSIHVSADQSREYSIEELHKIRNKLAQADVKRHIFSADADYYDLPENDRMPTAESDKLMGLSRTWTNQGDYTAPVEWNVYGDKLAIISFGKEPMGLIIESEQISEGFRQILKLLQEGVEARPDYDQLPKHHKYTKIPESVKRL